MSVVRPRVAVTDRAEASTDVPSLQTRAVGFPPPGKANRSRKRGRVMNVFYRGVVYTVWDESELLALVFNLKLRGAA